MRSAFIIDGMVMDSVLNALQYYSIFKYPLKAEEIYGNLAISCSLSSLLVALEDLDEIGKIFKFEGYYSLHEDVKDEVMRRKAANKLATEKKDEAIKVGRFIYKFPFVKFVGISGSLSKGYADKKSDFDFFIVTDERRLWICRTLLHLFKKTTFLAGQQHKFCMNYFVDIGSLDIKERNKFTAIELSSVIPVSGYDTFTQLERANNWVKGYLPNGYIGFHNAMDVIRDPSTPVKNLLEYLLNKLSPDRMNSMLMKLTDSKWRRKWAKKKFPMEEYDLAFKTTLHISKNHPLNHQKKILNAISRIEHGNK